MNPMIALRVGLAAAFVSILPVASADDLGPVPPARTGERVLVVGDGVARFHVTRDVSAKRLTFRLSDPQVRVVNPVIVTTTASGPREVQLVAVTGQPGTWTWTDDLVAAETFDGSLRVMVADKPYTSPLASVWTTTTVARRTPRYSGRLLMLSDCGAEVEVVQDVSTGKITIYSFDDVVVTEAPVITTSPAVSLTMTKVDGKTGAWVATHESLRTATSSARVRLIVNGKACEAPLLFASRGGQLVTVSGGPTWEVVRDRTTKQVTFYAIDETWDGKPYTIESPAFVVGERTYQMTPVAGQPRAWQVAGLDTAGSTSRDGQLNFTLLGKTLSTRVGLSGVGVDLR